MLRRAALKAMELGGAPSFSFVVYSRNGGYLVEVGLALLISVKRHHF